jgi:hypothetical protein
MGQVIAREPEALNSVSVALLDIRFTDWPDLAVLKGVTFDHVISCLLTTPDLFRSRRWLVELPGEVVVPRYAFPYEDTRETGFVGAKVIGSAIVVSFLEAFHGLSPWDALRDPGYFDKLRISPSKKPATVLYRGAP